MTAEILHPVRVDLVEDSTECRCQEPGCTFCERSGTGSRAAVAHGADHVAVTGHTVTECHVRTSVIRERAS